MRLLKNCLADEPLPRLTAIADAWDIRLEAASAREMVEMLAEEMLAGGAAAAGLDALPAEAQDRPGGAREQQRPHARRRLRTPFRGACGRWARAGSSGSGRGCRRPTPPRCCGTAASSFAASTATCPTRPKRCSSPPTCWLNCWRFESGDSESGDGRVQSPNLQSPISNLFNRPRRVASRRLDDAAQPGAEHRRAPAGRRRVESAGEAGCAAHAAGRPRAALRRTPAADSHSCVA